MIKIYIIIFSFLVSSSFFAADPNKNIIPHSDTKLTKVSLDEFNTFVARRFSSQDNKVYREFRGQLYSSDTKIQEEAFNSLSQLAKKNHTLAAVVMGQYWHEKKNFDQAKKYLKKAGNHPTALRVLCANSLKQEKLRKATNYLQKLNKPIVFGETEYFFQFPESLIKPLEKQLQQLKEDFLKEQKDKELQVVVQKLQIFKQELESQPQAPEKSNENKNEFKESVQKTDDQEAPKKPLSVREQKKLKKKQNQLAKQKKEQQQRQPNKEISLEPEPVQEKKGEALSLKALLEQQSTDEKQFNKAVDELYEKLAVVRNQKKKKNNNEFDENTLLGLALQATENSWYAADKYVAFWLGQEKNKENLNNAFSAAKTLFEASQKNKNQIYQAKALEYLEKLVEKSSENAFIQAQAYTCLFKHYVTADLKKLTTLINKLPSINLDTLILHKKLDLLLHWLEISENLEIQLKFVQALFAHKQKHKEISNKAETLVLKLMEEGNEDAIKLLFDRYAEYPDLTAYIQLFEKCLQKDSTTQLSKNLLNKELSRIKELAKCNKELGRKLANSFFSENSQLEVIKNHFSLQDILLILENNAHRLKDELAALQLGELYFQGNLIKKDEIKAFGYFVQALQSNQLVLDQKTIALNYAVAIQAKNKGNFDVCKQLVKALFLCKEYKKAFSLIFENFYLIKSQEQLLEDFMREVGYGKSKKKSESVSCQEQVVKALMLFDRFGKTGGKNHTLRNKSIDAMSEATKILPPKISQALKEVFASFYTKQAFIEYTLGNIKNSDSLANSAALYEKRDMLFTLGMHFIRLEKADLKKGLGYLSQSPEGIFFIAEEFLGKKEKFNKEGYKEEDILKALNSIDESNIYLFFKEYFIKRITKGFLDLEVFNKEIDEKLKNAEKSQNVLLCAKGLANFLAENYQEAWQAFNRISSEENKEGLIASALSGYLLFTGNGVEKNQEEGRKLLSVYLKSPLNMNDFALRYIQQNLLRLLEERADVSAHELCLEVYLDSYNTNQQKPLLYKAFKHFSQGLNDLFSCKNNEERVALFKMFEPHYKQLKNYVALVSDYEESFKTLMAELYYCSAHEWHISIFNEGHDEFAYYEKAFEGFLNVIIKKRGKVPYKVNERLEVCYKNLVQAEPSKKKFYNNKLSNFDVDITTLFAYQRRQLIGEVKNVTVKSPYYKETNELLNSNLYAQYFAAIGSLNEKQKPYFAAIGSLNEKQKPFAYAYFNSVLKEAEKDSSNECWDFFVNDDSWLPLLDIKNDDEASMLACRFTMGLDIPNKKPLNNNNEEKESSEKDINEWLLELTQSKNNKIELQASSFLALRMWRTELRTADSITETLSKIKEIAATERLDPVVENNMILILSDLSSKEIIELEQKSIDLLQEIEKSNNKNLANQVRLVILAKSWLDNNKKTKKVTEELVIKLGGCAQINRIFGKSTSPLLIEKVVKIVAQDLIDSLDYFENADKNFIANLFSALIETLKDCGIFVHITIPESLGKLDKKE